MVGNLRDSTALVIRCIVAAFGGMLTDLAFAPNDVWPAAMAGMALLLFALRGLGLRAGWLVGFCYGMAFYLPHLAFTAVSSGTPIAWIALVVVEAAITACAPAAMTFALRAPGLRRSSARSAAARAVVVACIWVVVEQIRAVWPWSGLPWGILAFSQTDSPLVTLAALGGEVLVSGTVVLAAAFTTEAVSALVQSSRQWPDLLVEVDARHGEFARPVTATMLLGVGALVTVALPAVASVRSPQPVGELTAVIAQGNVPEAGADWRINAMGVVEGHAEATERALRDHEGRVDVVLWPESASDLDPRTFPEVERIVERVAVIADAPVLLGTQDFRPSIADATERSNEYITWVAGQGAVGSYTKQEPVAFGEYMPLRDILRTITPAVDRVGTDMVSGTEPGFVEIPGAGTNGAPVPIAVGICFEVGYQRIIREGVVMGGEIIVIPTNNASFGWSREAAQQSDMSRFRAIEHGRTVVQVSTMGISSIITSEGQVVWSTDMWERAATVARLPRAQDLTLADRLGDLPLIVATLLGGGAALAGAMMTVRERRPARQAADSATPTTQEAQ